MNYELAKELKDAGFPIRMSFGRPASGVYVFSETNIDTEGNLITSGDALPVPTLEELLNAVGEHEVYFFGNGSIGYKAWVGDTVVQGATAVEVAAKLWLALNKK